ncbi:protein INAPERTURATE POLLEN1 [Nymphaea colorata]|nr:protein INAPERTURATE POLLEN1 [Nymphaea colorata]
MRTGENRKANSCVFKDFYLEWLQDLKALLPLLQQAIDSAVKLLNFEVPVTHTRFKAMTSSPTEALTTHVQMLHQHFQAYFNALDHAAQQDVTQVLCPEWHNSIETPFLWLGSWHPAVFSNLLRAFISKYNNMTHGSVSCMSSFTRSDQKKQQFSFAWTHPSPELFEHMEQIDRGLRLMIPAILSRMRDVQISFVGRIGCDWVTSISSSGGEGTVQEMVTDIATEKLEELTSIFVDANRQRGSILAEIIGALDIYQSALYLEGLAKFIIGFRSPELVHDMEHSKLPVSPH